MLLLLLIRNWLALKKVLPNAAPIVRTHEEDAETNRKLEDIFAPESYLELVNAAHKDVNGYQAIEINDIDPKKAICDAIQDQFKRNNLGRFQKLHSAMELQKLLELGRSPYKSTLERFATLFQRLNEALDR